MGSVRELMVLIPSYGSWRLPLPLIRQGNCTGKKGQTGSILSLSGPRAATTETIRGLETESSGHGHEYTWSVTPSVTEVHLEIHLLSRHRILGLERQLSQENTCHTNLRT